MTKLKGEIFEKLYLELFEILGKASERPSKTKLMNLYRGIGGVPGFCSYNQGTFAKLCGLAQRECQWMPTPAWFEERRSLLSAPGRETIEAQKALPGSHEVPDPGVVARALAKATKEYGAVLTFQKERAGKLVAWTEKEWIVDQSFEDWVFENCFNLAGKYEKYRRRAKSNKNLLVHLLTRCSAVQLEYIQYLDKPTNELDDYLKELSKRMSAVTH
jgi:hypothetical protein